MASISLLFLIAGVVAVAAVVAVIVAVVVTSSRNKP